MSCAADASQYKDYVLVLLFVKYVSDKYAGDTNALIDVPAGGRFADMVALKNDEEIGDKINKLVSHLADANETLKGSPPSSPKWTPNSPPSKGARARPAPSSRA